MRTPPARPADGPVAAAVRASDGVTPGGFRNAKQPELADTAGRYEGHLHLHSYVKHIGRAFTLLIVFSLLSARVMSPGYVMALLGLLFGCAFVSVVSGRRFVIDFAAGIFSPVGG